MIGSSAHDWLGTVQKHAKTYTTLKQVDLQKKGRREYGRFWLCDILAGQLMVVYSILLVDLSPTFYYLPKPLLVYGSMLLLSTLILYSYSIIVVMLG